MTESWDKCKCEQCGEEYIFIDGPGCLCEGEWESYNRKYNEAFADNTFRSDENGN